MSKRTEFKHHSVRIEKGLFLGSQQLDILGVHLNFLDAVLTSGTITTSEEDWVAMNLITLMAAIVQTESGVNYAVPSGAIAVILDVEVNDDNSDAAECKMEFAPVEHNYLGPLSSHEAIVYAGDVDDRKAARTVIVWLSDTMDILRKISVSGNFDYQIKLIGWLIGGTRVSLAQWPSEELFAKFEIARQTWAGWKAS